jgi:uncharacterized protein with HEPN domain
MYDKSLIIESLYNIEESLLHILNRTSWIKTVADFFETPSGIDMMDITTVRLMAIGEEIKKIDKRTGGELFLQYPEINWKNIMGLRDYIAHAYFRIDAVVVFDTLQNNLRPLLSTIQQMIKDLEI